MSYVSELKQRVVNAEAEVEHLKGLLDSFFSGDVPDHASLTHMVLAKWGRRRLEEIGRTPALLRTDTD